MLPGREVGKGGEAGKPMLRSWASELTESGWLLAFQSYVRIQVSPREASQAARICRAASTRVGRSSGLDAIQNVQSRHQFSIQRDKRFRCRPAQLLRPPMLRGMSVASFLTNWPLSFRRARSSRASAIRTAGARWDYIPVRTTAQISATRTFAIVWCLTVRDCGGRSKLFSSLGDTRQLWRKLLRQGPRRTDSLDKAHRF